MLHVYRRNPRVTLVTLVTQTSTKLSSVVEQQLAHLISTDRSSYLPTQIKRTRSFHYKKKRVATHSPWPKKLIQCKARHRRCHPHTTPGVYLRVATSDRNTRSTCELANARLIRDNREDDTVTYIYRSACPSIDPQVWKSWKNLWRTKSRSTEVLS